MSVVDHPGLTNRMVKDPNSIDIADIEIWQTKVAVPQGAPQAVEIAKIKNWDELTPLYTEGTFAGKEVSRQGDSPFEFMYREAVDATASRPARPSGRPSARASTTPTRWASVPTWSAARSPAGATSSRPDFKGKTAIQNIPTIGIMDAIMAFEAAGMLKYGDKGNPTQEELTADDRQADRAEEGRPLARAVEHLRRVA